MSSLAAAAIVVAGGLGVRFGGERPKQFLDLLGRPLFAWSVRVFLGMPEIARVALVVPRDHVDACRESVPDDDRAAAARLLVTAGGPSRAHSVRAGLQALLDDFDGGASGGSRPRAAFGPILIHDAARPGLSRSPAARVLSALATADAAVPVLPIADSVLRLRSDDANRIESYEDRARLRTIQTPQGVRLGAYLPLLEAALAAGRSPGDDAVLVLEAGGSVALVDGDPGNLKVTGPEDLDTVRARLIREGSSS